MTIKPAIISQYQATFQMLKQAITQCPPEQWVEASYKNPTWLIAYHVIFYTHLYLSPTEADFVPWEKGRENLQFMNRFPWPPHDEIERGEPYTQTDLLDYLAICEQTMKAQIAAVDLEAESGFAWIPFNKLELQFYNIRHLQHHTGEICERLGAKGKVEIDWVGQGAE